MVGKRSTRPSSRNVSSGQPRKPNGSFSARLSAPRHSDDSFGSDNDNQPSDNELRSAKRRKVSKPRSNRVNGTGISIFQNCGTVSPEPCCPSSGRQHSLSYHKPLFLCDSRGFEHRQALLSWFDSVSMTRAMPWRKPWINPSTEPDASQLRKLLERRAYEVWISEIMLQQTRVVVVIDYWNRWMDKWPTIQDLAAADPEDVLAAWRGLGYYSRATRIHEASKLVVGDPAMQGLLPSATNDLEAKVPGVGRYTAGAISAIVFGRAAPMVDGNVLRVLSRQLGIYGNIKTDKKVIDAIWAAADALVQTVALDRPDDEDESEVSDRPGRWGQALMELGSTVCTPKPNCSQCPVTASCRVYSEAKNTEQNRGTDICDIEDLCTLCEPLEEETDNSPEPTALQESKPNPKTTDKNKGPKQMTLAAFSFTGGKPAKQNDSKKEDSGKNGAEAISNYARKFPLKTAKKPVREEETVVCAIRRPDGSYLLHRRPDKGLLAGLWEFPSKTLPSKDDYATTKQRTALAKAHMKTLLGGVSPKHMGELGSVPWLFSHLKLTMHVHLFRVGENGAECGIGDRARWSDDVEGESMGTGMRKCWALVKDAE
ncbi:Adenine DNA glycosylase [Metarhizium brunneum]|uniref:Adenine DNA glycosylase n=1 Tax=Metarhizium brunneum TaxID=500148 RepID=A0A7D5V0F1_9HYPO